MKQQKQAAPKRDETIKKEKAFTRLDAPKPSMNKVSEKDMEIEAKAIKKAEKNASKKKEVKSEKNEKVLHFHFFRFLLNLFLFVATTIGLTLLTIALLFNGQEFIIGSTTITIPSLNGNVVFLIGVIIMVAFAIWMAELQLGIRRLFGIGKYERIRKAQAKLKSKSKSKKKAI